MCVLSCSSSEDCRIGDGALMVRWLFGYSGVFIDKILKKHLFAFFLKFCLTVVCCGRCPDDTRNWSRVEIPEHDIALFCYTSCV